MNVAFKTSGLPLRLAYKRSARCIREMRREVLSDLYAKDWIRSRYLPKKRNHPQGYLFFQKYQCCFSIFSATQVYLFMRGAHRSLGGAILPRRPSGEKYRVLDWATGVNVYYVNCLRFSYWKNVNTTGTIFSEQFLSSQTLYEQTCFPTKISPQLKNT